VVRVNGGFDLGLQVAPGSLELRARRDQATETPRHERKLPGIPDGSEQVDLPATDLARIALGKKAVEFQLNLPKFVAIQSGNPMGDSSELIHSGPDTAERTWALNLSPNDAEKVFDFQRVGGHPKSPTGRQLPLSLVLPRGFE
jgi:hypothetical protein